MASRSASRTSHAPRLARAAVAPRRGRARQADQRLLAITRQVLSDLSIEQIIHTSLLALHEHLAADTCAWYWVEAAAGLVRPAANLEGTRFLTPELQSWPIPLGRGLVGLAASTGQALLVNDAPHDPRSIYPPGYQPRSLHMLCLPLLVRDQPVAVVAVGRVTDHPFTRDDFEFAQLIVSQTALAVSKARLLERIQQMNTELEEAVSARTSELRVANERLTQQLAEIEALQAQLREQANRDHLTGLYNRRYLQDTLDREVDRAAREARTLAIVIMDIDHFKAINDRFGHAAGDQMIQALGQLLQAQTRGGDVACRFGGEEFLVVLPGAELAAAQARAEQWRAAFQAQRVAFPGGALQATLSLGVAAFPAHGQTGEQVVRRADQALYQAKAGGRNRVVVA